jgi:hypothetical protein
MKDGLIFEPVLEAENLFDAVYLSSTLSVVAAFFTVIRAA